MTDFGVAHLPVRQADEVLAGTQQGVWVLAQQPVVGGLARLRDGVAVGLGAVAPAIENGEDDRTFFSGGLAGHGLQHKRRGGE